MSHIKLKIQSTENSLPGISLDIDENNVPFNRLTFKSKHPVTGEIYHWELNKNDSKNLIIKEGDNSYVESDDIEYLQDSWAVEEYNKGLFMAWRTAVKDVDVPEEWWDRVQVVPINAAMWDDVYVNKKRVKIDYSLGCEGFEKDEIDRIVARITEKFPNEYNFFSNPYNIIGKYLPNHTIRPPYKSQKTITVYHMYYDKAWFQELLKEYKVPDYSYEYRFWVGLKYDLESGERYLKLVFLDNERTNNLEKYPESYIPRPKLPECSHTYFAKIYNPDGTEADEYDIFFTTTAPIMKKYCEENNLDFPIPEIRENEYIWVYGLVYDKNTLEIKQVKGYVKVAQNLENWVSWT